MPAGSEAFYTRVYEVVAHVPAGRVVTYAQVARHLGRPNGARIVGWAMRHCPADVPWQRVVNAQGGISTSGQSDSGAVQRALLEEEGIVFDSQGYIDLSVYAWDGI